MDKGKKINWKNGLLLSAVSYLLYNPLAELI